MGFLGLNWGKNKQPVTTEANNAKVKNDNYKNFIVKAIGFIASQGASRAEFEDPEYDLTEIKLAADSDSYIKMALMKYSYLIFKAGYTLKGDNENAVEYIKTRFRVMGLATGKPMDILFQEIGDDLVKYSNAFLIKSRVDRVMPGISAKGVLNTKPVGGYFRVDPSTISIQRDKFGSVKWYQQTNDNGEEKKFAPTEVIHFYMDKDPNNAFGTPRIIAALEDVKLLRRIEGNIISLIYRFAIPIYQWMIGLPETGFQATDKEILEAQKEIENMPLDGVIVTNEKTNIKAIGAEGNALDASAYLAYFEQRVFTALGVSETQMGRGTAKQNADSMESQAHDTVKYIQRIMSIFIENFMLNELLLEGGFNPIFNEEDSVNYVFDEISLDTKIKVENHEMLKYQSNLNTFDEARRATGRRADNVDENRLYQNMIENKSAIDQINAKTQGALEVAKAGAAARGAGVSGNGSTKSAKPNGSATNNNRPANQHGTTSVKIKESADDSEIEDSTVQESLSVEEKSNKKLRNHKNSFPGIYKKYETMRNDISENGGDPDLILPVGKDSMLSDMKMFVSMWSFDGMQKAVQDINTITGVHNLIPNSNIHLDSFVEEANETITGILKDINKRLKLTQDPSIVKATFDTLEYRVRYMLEFILPKVYWYSYVKTGAELGIDKAYIIFNGSDDAKDHPAEIDTHAFSVDEIPAYHSFCNCKVSFKAGDKE